MASVAGRGDAAALRTLVRFASEGKRLVSEEITSGKDSRGFIGRVDTGATKNAIRAGPIERTARGYRAILQAQPPHDRTAMLIERGRRVGARVPGSGSAGWVKVRAWVAKHLRNEALQSLQGAVVKIGRGGKPKVGGKRSSAVVTVRGPNAKARTEQALDNMTFLVLRAMKRKGTPGLFPFKKAAHKLREGGGLAKIYREELRASRSGR